MPIRKLATADVLAGILVILITGAVALRAADQLSEEDARKQCASQLRQIGQALLIYSNDNKGPYPRGPYAGGESVKPVWGTSATSTDPFMPGGPQNDVTAALYLLLRTQDITSKMFVCPSTMKEGWNFGGGRATALNWSNWNGAAGIRDHLSYSYSNPYPDMKGASAGYKLNNSLGAEFAVAGDMNPGTDALLKLSARSSPVQMRDGNSLNHFREGQNVLYGDGHVEFQVTPFCGTQRDNIYTFGPSGPANADKPGEGIVGSPSDANDSILLPTAKDVGLADATGTINADVTWQKPPPAELPALKQKLVGQYTLANPAVKATLQISGDRMIVKSGPVTVDYSYAIEAKKVGERIKLKISAPDARDESIEVAGTSEGLVISGNRFFEGRWTRQR